MHASTTSPDRLTVFDAPNLKGDGAVILQNRITAFVRGIRGDRKTPVSEAQIVAYFGATDPEFVREQLSAACAAGTVQIVRKSLSSGRRHNGAYRYEIAPS